MNMRTTDLPLSGVSNPRQRVDLSDGPTVNTTPNSNQLHPSSTTSTTRRTYAETLAGAAARTNNPKYRPVYTRPTGEMLVKLIQLADDESIDDDTMLLAIEEARPFKVRQGVDTLWVATNNALQEFSNDRIIATVLKENEVA
ncbi:Aste57867_5257 [Aphanomyces stellatus]|uniref:Aste57867_5257 protein n=1 Tax=Aphanomyces stellatus TaxID=120398 RepID=A0A485KE05_9STRA|nr:hypothetical protein As57867_005244 [Aphanomyces stellatus]VFT82327.1 Aste57867_5257 [Aphanomyces stellatus]